MPTALIEMELGRRARPPPGGVELDGIVRREFVVRRAGDERRGGIGGHRRAQSDARPVQSFWKSGLCAMSVSCLGIRFRWETVVDDRL